MLGGTKATSTRLTTQKSEGIVYCFIDVFTVLAVSNHRHKSSMFSINIFSHKCKLKFSVSDHLEHSSGSRRPTC